MTTDAFSFSYSFADDPKSDSEPKPDSQAPTDSSAEAAAAPETVSEEAPDPFGLFDFGSTTETEAQPATIEAEAPELTASPVEPLSFDFDIDAAQSASDDLGNQDSGLAPSGELDFEEELNFEEGQFSPGGEPISQSAEQSAPQTLDFGLQMPDFASNPLISAGAELPTLRSVDDTPESDTEHSALQMPLEIPPAAVVPASPHQMVDAEAENEADPFAPFIKAPPHRPVVAILGASGIGKNHARWFHRHDCHVAAFLGQDEGTLANTTENMRADFGFDGQGYRDLGVLLREIKPEIVCVSTPSEFHFAHALAALEAGAHVLCEKPLVYAPGRKARENMEGAKELVKVAKKNDLLLGTQLQYGAATPILCKLAGLTPPEVGDFAMEIETTNSNAPRDPHELWLDLGSHPISVAQFLAGEGATLIPDSLQFFTRTQGEGAEASARFGVRRADGRMLAVRAITRFVPREAISREPYRRFSFNGRVVAYNGKRLKNGQYTAQYTAPDGYDNVYPDPVDFLVGNFVRAVKAEDDLLIDGEFGQQNLEWLLKIGA